MTFREPLQHFIFLLSQGIFSHVLTMPSQSKGARSQSDKKILDSPSILLREKITWQAHDIKHTCTIILNYNQCQI